MVVRIVVAALLVVIGAAEAFAEAPDNASVQTTWRLLDYVAVDYREAVRDGSVVSESEYREMAEFSASARERIEGLPVTDAQPALRRDAAAIERAIADKAAPDRVSALARALAAALIRAYPVAVAPALPPDPARGRVVYAEHCAGCHGATGAGDGPAAVAAKLDPPPVAFTDEERARERSTFAFYQVVGQGIDGTSMASFAETLSPQDRWAVALYAGSLAYPENDMREGGRVWRGNAALRASISLERLVGLRPAELEAEFGERDAKAVVAYLRRHPETTIGSGPGSLALARGRLDESLAAYRRGDRKAATDLALSAYLDGFEPVEPILSARDNPLMVRIEGAMGALRAEIARGAPTDEVEHRVRALDGLFGEAETALARNDASVAANVVAAFTILVREGLEALLIVVAMIAFLDRAGRRDLLPWVHGGWIAALLAGLATWAVATWAIAISGASRELTEGFGSLFAAFVLVWVGVWMHGKSHADAWQRYVREALGRVLTRRSAWFLFGLSFVVVYREVFETILFFAALWSESGAAPVLGGAAAGGVALAGLAWAMTRYSRILPVGRFFAWSAILIALLAVVLTGKGVSALQEAGALPVIPIPALPRVEWLGLYPTREGLVSQAAVMLLLVIGFSLTRRAAAAGTS